VPSVPTRAIASPRVTQGSGDSVELGDGTRLEGGEAVPNIRTGAPIRVQGGQLEVDPAAVVGEGATSWDDATQQVVQVAPVLRTYTAADFRLLAPSGWTTEQLDAVTLQDVDGGVLVTLGTRGVVRDGVADTLKLIAPVYVVNEGSALTTLSARTHNVLGDLCVRKTGAGSILQAWRPLVRSGICSGNTASWTPSAIDHANTVGIIGHTSEASMRRTQDSGHTSPSDFTTGMTGIDRAAWEFRPADPVSRNAGFGTLGWDMYDGSMHRENASFEATVAPAGSGRWALVVELGQDTDDQATQQLWFCLKAGALLVERT
jgi:hypothetical protein